MIDGPSWAFCHTSSATATSKDDALDHLGDVGSALISCRPLFSTAITRPPIIEPMTVPTPPETAAPPDEDERGSVQLPADTVEQARRRGAADEHDHA